MNALSLLYLKIREFTHLQPQPQSQPQPQPKIAFMIKHFLDPRFSLMALFLALTVVSAICPSECVGDSFNNVALQAAVAAWCDNSTAAFDVYGDITTWCVGDVTSMQGLFAGNPNPCSSFNENIGCWDVR